MERKPELDVIVVGAGYAGLTAARHCMEKGFKVKVLEARDRVGGRVHTQVLENGAYIDLGGQWIGPGQDKIYALTKEFNVETFPTYNEGKSVLFFKNRHQTYQGLIPPLRLPVLLSLDRAIKKINRLSKKIDLKQPWRSPEAEKLDEVSLAHWMRKNMWFKEARTFFTIAIEAIFAAPPQEISLLHTLFYVKSGRDLDSLMNINNGAQEERILGGAQVIADRMAAKMKDQIHLNAPVTRIIQDAFGVEVCGRDYSLKSKKVIVAIPPVMAQQIEFEPQLSPNRLQLLQRMPMGAVMKCYAIYEKPFWRAKGLNGLGLADSGCIKVCFDNSPKDGSKGILMGFALANEARRLAGLPQEERKKEMLECFIHFFGPEAKNAQVYIDKSWQEDPWAKGCYAAVIPCGLWTSFGGLLREPAGNIHWAGTETSDIWNGYIDGAIRSGERAAAEIIQCESQAK